MSQESPDLMAVMFEASISSSIRPGYSWSRFEIDGCELCLCAVGGLADAREFEVERSLRGVRRILTA